MARVGFELLEAELEVHKQPKSEPIHIFDTHFFILSSEFHENVTLSCIRV